MISLIAAIINVWILHHQAIIVIANSQTTASHKYSETVFVVDKRLYHWIDYHTWQRVYLTTFSLQGEIINFDGGVPADAQPADLAERKGFEPLWGY